MADELGKGERIEEVMREYFLSIGYFVIRGAKFRYKEFDVTDVDLFLYSKSSPLSRQRSIVDIKRKKTPQAIERIFWTKGLQMVLEIDNSMVVTTDNRPDVVEFGRKNGVTVFDGSFVSRIEERSKKKVRNRLVEEELLQLLKGDRNGDLFCAWNQKYNELKSLLLTDINFNTCNKILITIREILEYLVTSNMCELSVRLLYIALSYFLVSLDFSMKDIIYYDEEERARQLEKYFRYGQNGYQRMQDVSRHLENILQAYGQSNTYGTKIIRDSMENEFKGIRSEIMAEYFGKLTNAGKLFELDRKSVV